MTLERLKQLRAMVYADYECLSEFGDDVQYEKDLLELIDAEIGRNKSGKWISVKERMPDDSGLYLVAYNNNGGLSIEISLLTHHERKFTSSWDSGQFHDLVTHWMPLPKLPKEVE